LQWAFRMHGFDESRPEGVEEGTIAKLVK